MKNEYCLGNRWGRCFLSCVLAVVLMGLPGFLLELGAKPVSQSDLPEAERALLEKMEERLAEVMALKLSGKVGENHLGLLEAREPLDRAERRLMADENRDRQTLYASMAARLRSNGEAVGTARAERLRKESPKGVWLRSEDGAQWYQKD